MATTTTVERRYRTASNKQGETIGKNCRPWELKITNEDCVRYLAGGLDRLDRLSFSFAKGDGFFRIGICLVDTERGYGGRGDEARLLLPFSSPDEMTYVRLVRLVK